ncbi:MAG: hypothetical protein JWN96_1729, partial [Mycobacterium sp.]|nr:hypothetical protein [Mycobacterium sp.]
RDRVIVTGTQVIQNDDLVAALDETGTDHASDVAGSAGNQELHVCEC